MNAVPRPSKKEERDCVHDGIRTKLGLPTVKDHVGNVIIKNQSDSRHGKPQTIVMHRIWIWYTKNNDTNFDFDTQGIEMYVDGDWVC